MSGRMVREDRRTLVEGFIPETFSPDEKWIAYRATTTGAQEVFVRAFPDTGAKYQISSASGQSPVWSREGKELFWFDMRGRIFATAYRTQENVFVPGKTRMVTDVVANPTRDRGWRPLQEDGS